MEGHVATVGDPLQAAQDLRPVILDARQETEENRRLAPQVVEGLIETGLCRLVVPADLGGYEVDPRIALQVFEELAKAEASVAWIVWNNALPCFSSAVFAEAMRAELFSDVRRLFANSARPSGKAAAVDGGFRVSGRWSLVSGCELAEWIPVMNIVTEDGMPRMVNERMPETRMTYIPRGSYKILDTWYVGGLRGTGSHDIVVDDVFVPQERTYSFMDPVLLDRPLYRMPFWATTAAGCAAICAGLAQRALDTVLELAASKVTVEPIPDLGDRPAVRSHVAASAAELDAARLLLQAAVSDLWETCTQSAQVTDTQRARLWTSAVHMAQTAKAIITKMYEVADTSALYTDCPLERAHRDVHAICQHGILAPMWFDQAGKVYFGLTPNNPLFSR